MLLDRPSVPQGDRLVRGALGSAAAHVHKEVKVTKLLSMVQREKLEDRQEMAVGLLPPDVTTLLAWAQ